MRYTLGILFVVALLAIGYIMVKSNKKNAYQVMESADTPEEIAAMIKSAAKEIEVNSTPNYPDPMLPPWEIMPDEPMPSLAWRMGAGEDYRKDFSDWFHQLSVTDKRKYVTANPEPEDWIGYYDLIEERRKSSKSG